jgi:leucyl aminopeptidase
MEIHVTHRPAAELRADLLAVPLGLVDPKRRGLPARLAGLDAALGGRLGELIRAGDFRGKRGESQLLWAGASAPSPRVLLVGLGDESQLDGQGAREAAASAVSAALGRSAKEVAVVAPATRRLRLPALAQALAEGAVLAGYRFDRHRAANEEGRRRVESLHIAIERAADARAARAAAATGAVLADSQNLARDLSNEPPNVLPPRALARAAERMAKEVGLRCRILDVAELRRRKMGALLAVAGGSANPPQVIVLEHGGPRGARGGRGARERAPVCLVGKGVTFDSGGLSIKPTASMVTMKHDMSGGAAVIGALRACALLKLPVHVVGIVGAVENMPSGTAYRPDDILTSMSGKTIEVGNTDAEGRLVLADVLHFAKTEYRPAAMIDVATLTGACAVALGPWAAAVLSNHERLADLVRRAGELAGERFWPLPLWDVHREHMRSQIADVRQVGGRDAGTVTAAAFLWHFAGDDVPWAHLDIAPTANTERGNALQQPGATGFAVRTLVEFLRGWRDQRLSAR